MQEVDAGQKIFFIMLKFYLTDGYFEKYLWILIFDGSRINLNKAEDAFRTVSHRPKHSDYNKI